MKIIVYSFVIAALLLFPQTCAQSARGALSVWALQIVPSLFPYMVVSKMLANQMKKYSFPPSVLCMLLGMLGGSPSGACAISACSARLTNRSMMALCAFTGTISPMFFLATLKSWTGDSLLAKELLLFHYSGAALSAVCVYLFPIRRLHFKASGTEASQVASPLSDSIDAILQVGGCIICFSVAAGMMALLPLPKETIPFIHALLEISGGMHALAGSPISAPMKKLLLAFTSGFGGLSILFQNLLFLRPVGIQLPILIALSVLRGLFSVLCMALKIKL